MTDGRSGVRMVILGLVIAFGLIWFGWGGNLSRNPELVGQFAPRPLAPGEPTPEPFTLPQVRLPDLPPEVQQAVSNASGLLQSGQAAPALTPVAEGERARVQVVELRRDGEKVRVRGTVANIGVRPLEIPSGAFSFRDSAGTTYTTAGSGGATLQSNESTSFDLTVPLPEGRGLTLILTVPPDPPLEQVLAVEVAS